RERRSAALSRGAADAGIELASGRRARGRSRRNLETAFDLRQLLVRPLTDRSLEPLPCREHVPTAEEEERAEDRQRRVVEEEPVEVRLERDAALVGGQQEHDADEDNPE